MAPMIASAPGVNKELLVVSIGAGSLIASHVNDGGFWLVKEYLNMTVQETLATWTVLETVVSLGLAGVLSSGGSWGDPDARSSVPRDPAAISRRRFHPARLLLLRGDCPSDR